jgi:RNA polymerase sigma-70 factor (ECF subfamily)
MLHDYDYTARRDTPMDERDQIARLQQGDLSGLAGLVATHQVQAVRTAYLICHDRALAEDIVQAAFLRAYERITQFDPSRPFGPWFLRSVINDAIKAADHRERGLSLDHDGGGPMALLVSPTPDPLALLMAAETQEAIWGALARLTPMQRAAVVLRYYLDWSEAEMAEYLECPPGTVKRRLHDARLRLRRLLPSWLRRERIATPDVSPNPSPPM